MCWVMRLIAEEAVVHGVVVLECFEDALDAAFATGFFVRGVTPSPFWGIAFEEVSDIGWWVAGPQDAG